jgi:hypothetical protein
VGLLFGFVVLLSSSLLLGLTLNLSFRALRAVRLGSGSKGEPAAGRDLRPVFPALGSASALFLLLSVRPVLAAVLASLPAFLGFGVVSAAAIAFLRGRRSPLRGGIAASGLFAGVLALFVFSLFRFLTAAMSPLSGETLAALVEVEPIRLARPLHFEKGPASISVQAGSPAVRLTLSPVESGDVRESLQFELPGEKWGVGGEVLEVRHWLLFFGSRAFFRLTHVDAKFRDNEVPHYGRNLPGYDPAEVTARLEEKIPLLERTVRDLTGARVESTRYEDVVYRAIDDGRHFALYARDRGGFVPRAISEEEYRRRVGSGPARPTVVP